MTKQSNPFSTGGGGSNFETRVQAAFVVQMLTGNFAPCLPPYPIVEIKLQGRYDGYFTDDFIAFTSDTQSKNTAKLLAQIKHKVTISEKDETFAQVIQSAWDDFNGELFDISKDSIALITGQLAEIDIQNVRPILEWARHSRDENDFLNKVETPHFSSEKKQRKLAAFRLQLQTANHGEAITDYQLWRFLQSFYLISYDLDIESGSILPLIQSLISRYAIDSASHLWGRIVDVVQNANQNAGTLTIDNLPADLRETFKADGRFPWPSDIEKLRQRSDYIQDSIVSTVAEVHIEQIEYLAGLATLVEESDFVYVTGQRGSGKSSLVKEFFADQKERVVFYLRTEDLEQPHLDQVFFSMGLTSSLDEMSLNLSMIPQKYLVLESFEKLLELRRTSAFVDLLNFLKRDNKWTIIATGREYAHQQIVFNFLEPHNSNYSTLSIEGFSNQQVDIVCEQFPQLNQIATNRKLRFMLRNPFFANLAYRTLKAGEEFSTTDSEMQFQQAVWRSVIAKEQSRIDGMPMRRRQTFIDIAVTRAKKMTYGIPIIQFDSDVVMALEADDLVIRDDTGSMVSPAHDVFEDWALDHFIESVYEANQDNISHFLKLIGSEPAINRSFRLWLTQKLKIDTDNDKLIGGILTNTSISRHWQDETIAAIFANDDPSILLDRLASRLLLNEGQLLQRFCFILQIACQVPKSPLTFPNSGRLDLLFLQPNGKGWEALIRFLYKFRDQLSPEVRPHIASTLEEWLKAFQIAQPYPPAAREAGLLALFLLKDVKDNYRDEGDRKSFLRVIIQTASVIHKEFVELIERDILLNDEQENGHRPSYVDDFCKMIFLGFDAAAFCNYEPDLLIELAWFEWLDKEPVEDEFGFSRSGLPIGVEECFGLDRYRAKMFPASGAKGVFQHLLHFHPRKGLDFILKLLNFSAEKYAYSALDSPNASYQGREQWFDQPQVPVISLKLNDETEVKQYASSRLWLAYRGHSVTPDVLQCALMALENWLISCVEADKSNLIDWLFDYILRKSNSVMPTAILASIATAFPIKVGKSAIPILSSPKTYHLDITRFIKDRVGMTINLTGFGFDPLDQIYVEERRTSNKREWRKETLESAIVRLQFSSLKEEALKAIDQIWEQSNDQSTRFLLHRIDSRNWTAKPDIENNRIAFEAEHLDPDLEQIQQETQEYSRKLNRLLAMQAWSQSKFENEELDRTYYINIREAIIEAKELFEMLKDGDFKENPLYIGGIVTAASVFVRDYLHELEDEDLSWCIELFHNAIIPSMNFYNPRMSMSNADLNGSAVAASVLPVLLDTADDIDDIQLIKQWIIIGITHASEEIRRATANGIREHLWQRDERFAEICFNVAIDYAKFEKDIHAQRNMISFVDGDERRKALSELKDLVEDFRKQILNSETEINYQGVSLETHSPWHILEPSLMIPISTTQSTHVAFLSQMLTLFFQDEMKKNNRAVNRDKRESFHYKVPLNFCDYFSKHFHHKSSAANYIEPLEHGCHVAPDFINYLLLCVAVEAEKVNKPSLYWHLWQQLSSSVQQIAVKDKEARRDRFHSPKSDKLIRNMLKSNNRWKNIDSENAQIAEGRELLLNFASNTGENPIVFHGLAKLLFHFPILFFKDGIHILSKHQATVGGTQLLQEVNTAYYVEVAIQRYLSEQEGSISRKMHSSFLVLLNGIVETASSRAYFIRERLIHAHRIG